MNSVINNTKKIGRVLENTVVFSEFHDIFGKVLGGIILLTCILFYHGLSIGDFSNFSHYIENVTEFNFIIILCVIGILIILYIVGIFGSLIFSAYIFALNTIFGKLVILPKVGGFFTKVYSYFWQKNIYEDKGISPKYIKTIETVIPKYLGTSVGYGDLVRLAKLLRNDKKTFDKSGYYYSLFKNISVGLVLIAVRLFHLSHYFEFSLVLIFLISVQNKFKSYQFAKDLESIDSLLLRIKLEKNKED